MKKAIGHIIRVIASILLILLAIVLTIILAPIAFVHQIYISVTRENRNARDILIGTKQFFTSIAASIDQFGNTAFAALFNSVLLIDAHLKDHAASVYLFGNKDETISEVLGWNEQFFTYSISRTGTALIWLLNQLEKDHCFNAYVKGKDAAKEKIEILNDLIKTTNTLSPKQNNY